MALEALAAECCYGRAMKLPSAQAAAAALPLLCDSVQGFGRRGNIGGWFYPGSGATADSTVAAALKPLAEGAAGPPGAGSSGGAPPEGGGAAAAAVAAGLSAAAASAAAEAAAAAGAPAGGLAANAAAGSGGDGIIDDGGSGDTVPEDPEGEFRGTYDVTVVGGPRIINVGIPGPGTAGGLTGSDGPAGSLGRRQQQAG